MRSYLVASVCFQAFGVVAAAYASNGVHNVFTSLASKFPRSGSMVGLAVGPTVTTGYLQAESFFNSDDCSSDVYAIEYVSLGVCGNYNANYSDPNAVPMSCGKFVKASAYTSTAMSGTAMLNLNYTFFTDASCSVSGTGSGCTQSVAIQSSCFVSEYAGISSSAKGFLTDTINIPTTGYHAMTHLSSTCNDSPYSGLWQRTGCTQLSSTDSAYAYCTDTTYEYNEYSNSASCGGTAVLQDSKPLHTCDANVFNGGEASAVEYGIGYSMTSCSTPPSAEPTAEPSTEPTAEPTAEPTVPTVPSATITSSSSAANSAAPSPGASAVPSAATTVKPTARPSAQPSGATRAPTKQNSPVVTFTSTVTIAGLASATLDVASQNAIVTTTAAAMGIDPSHVVYLSASAAVSPSTQEVQEHETEEARAAAEVDSVLSSVHHALHHGALGANFEHGAKKGALATVNAVTQTTISLASTAYTTTDELYQGLTGDLTAAVDGGTYSTMLQNSGVSDLAAADATGVASSPASVTDPSSGGGSDSSLSAGAIAGIVIGAVAFVVLLGVIYYFTAGKGAAGSEGGSSRRANNRSTNSDYYGKDSEMVVQQSPLRGHSAV